MNHRLIFIAIILTIPACNRSASHESPAKPVSQSIVNSSQTEAVVAVDIEQLLRDIKSCNEFELDYFYRHWDSIHTKLKQVAGNGELAGLQIGKQEELWDALAYLQSCRDGKIMREHGDDMVKILFCFGTKQQLDLLRDIYPNVVPDAR